MSNDSMSRWERWARFQFSIIGPVLASPPEPGKLHQALEGMAGKARLSCHQNYLDIL